MIVTKCPIKGKEKEQNVLGGDPSKGYRSIVCIYYQFMVASFWFQNLLNKFSLIHNLERVPYSLVKFSVCWNSLGQALEDTFLTVLLKPLCNYHFQYALT